MTLCGSHDLALYSHPRSYLLLSLPAVGLLLPPSPAVFLLSCLHIPLNLDPPYNGKHKVSIFLHYPTFSFSHPSRSFPPSIRPPFYSQLYNVYISIYDIYMYIYMNSYTIFKSRFHMWKKACKIHPSEPNMLLPNDSAITVPALSHMQTTIQMFITVPFIVMENWEKPRCVSIDDQVNKYHTMGYYSAIKGLELCFLDIP